MVLPATPPWRLEREEDVSATEADGCVKASASHLQPAAWTPPLQPTVAPETGRAITPRRGEAEAPLHPQQQNEGIVRKMELQQKNKLKGKLPLSGGQLSAYVRLMNEAAVKMVFKGGGASMLASTCWFMRPSKLLSPATTCVRKHILMTLTSTWEAH